MRWLIRAARFLRKNLLTRRGPSWIDIGAVEEFPFNAARVVIARGVPLAVFHDETGISVIGDICPHMGASLSRGTLHPDGCVECPAHRMRFHLKTGACSIGPVYSARVFRFRQQDGRIEAFL